MTAIGPVKQALPPCVCVCVHVTECGVCGFYASKKWGLCICMGLIHAGNVRGWYACRLRGVHVPPFSHSSCSPPIAASVTHSYTLMHSNARMGGEFAWLQRSLLHQHNTSYFTTSPPTSPPHSHPTTFISLSPGKWHRILFNCSTFITTAPQPLAPSPSCPPPSQAHSLNKMKSRQST